jgi:FeS assembly SUF system protein
VISRDLFERRRLKVLNVDGPSQPTSSDYVLEDEAMGPKNGDIDVGVVRESAITILRTIKDPEIPLNIYDLGLIYGLDVDEKGRVEVSMTLTSPGCPVAGVLVRQVHDAVRRVPGVSLVRTQLVWEPPWNKDRLSDAARLALDLL